MSQSTSSERKYSVPAVERAILILQLLGDEWQGLTISEITKYLNLNKSTVYTILCTLLDHGIVNRNDETRRFRLGMELFRLGSIVVDNLELRPVAQPVLKHLAEQTGLATHLGIIDGNEVVYIEKIECRLPIKISSRVGARMGLHCTALGKVMLAHIPDEDRQRYLADSALEQRTSNTITQPRLLAQELNCIREKGYALDNEENEISIRCIAAPAFNHHQEVAGAVSISGHRDQIPLEEIKGLAHLLIGATQDLSCQLGYRP